MNYQKLANSYVGKLWKIDVTRKLWFYTSPENLDNFIKIERKSIIIYVLDRKPWIQNDREQTLRVLSEFGERWIFLSDCVDYSFEKL